jgi:hypothetical protein
MMSRHSAKPASKAGMEARGINVNVCMKFGNGKILRRLSKNTPRIAAGQIGNI